MRRSQLTDWSVRIVHEVTSRLHEVLNWASKMNSHLAFRPDLNNCILEERSLLATNFGVIVLTTSGLSFNIPFPGANNAAGGSLASGGAAAGSASSVSGVPVPTSLYITGSFGISSLRPGNITGNPGIGGATGARRIDRELQRWLRVRQRDRVDQQ